MGLWVRKTNHLLANGWLLAHVAPRVLVSPLMMTGERTALTLVHRFKLLEEDPTPQTQCWWGPAVSRLGRHFM